MYPLEAIPLPVHPYPSPSAPPISYSHGCVNNNHAYAAGGPTPPRSHCLLPPILLCTLSTLRGAVSVAVTLPVRLAGAEAVGMGEALFQPGTDGSGACTQMVTNRTRVEFNGSAESYIEINTNATSVRELRRAYYAVISLMDAQLGRVRRTPSPPPSRASPSTRGSRLSASSHTRRNHCTVLPRGHDASPPPTSFVVLR